MHLGDIFQAAGTTFAASLRFGPCCGGFIAVLILGGFAITAKRRRNQRLRVYDPVIHIRFLCHIGADSRQTIITATPIANHAHHDLYFATIYLRFEQGSGHDGLVIGNPLGTVPRGAQVECSWGGKAPAIPFTLVPGEEQPITVILRFTDPAGSLYQLERRISPTMS